MVSGFSLLTPRRIFLAFAVLLIAAGVAGRFAVAAESVGPSAAFTFDPPSPLSSDQINFTSGSTDDGTIVSQEWDFGDGGTASGDTAQHSYSVPGIYTVELTVTDDESLTATHTEDVTVGNRSPLADFHYAPTAPEIGNSITFTSDATDPESRIDTLRWDLDDDGSFEATGATVSRSFTSGGPHTVSLRVEDLDGGTDTISKTVDVIDPPNVAPTPAFTFNPADPMVLQTVTFTSSSSDSDGSIATTQWDFENDGIYDASGTQVTHSYLFGGDYTARLRVTDNEGAWKDLTKVVTVGVPPNDPPTANFTITPASPKTLETVSFDSTSTDTDGTIVSYGWELDGDNDFNDHLTDVATKVFSQSGTYQIALKVIDDDGDSHVATKSVVVANRQPTANFDFTPAAPKKNEQVTFNSLASDPENRIQMLEWDLDGDSQYDDAFGATAQKTFDTVGNNTVRLRVTDSDGGSHTVSKTVPVTGTPPSASFTFSPDAPLSAQRVVFTSTSSDPDGLIADVRWDTDNDGSFDDGNDIEADRTFTTPGAKVVKLRVTDDDGNRVDVSRTVQVANRAPVAKIDGPTAVQKNVNVTFKSVSTDVDGSIATIQWDIDNDGYDDGTGTQITKQFPATPSSRTIRLKVTDNSGAVDEDALPIVIGGNTSPTAAFTISNTNPLSLTNVKFDATGPNGAKDADGTIARYEWDFNSDGTIDATGGVVERPFSLPGLHLVTLKVVDDDGATHTLGKTVNVQNRAPTVSIQLLTPAPGTQAPIEFAAVADDPEKEAIQPASFLWDFDDGNEYDDASGISASWSLYKKAGKYLVRVQVKDARGAAGQATREVTVANSLPLATFAYDPVSPNPRDVVTLTSTSVDPDGSITKIEWDTDNDGAFDDGTGSKVTKAFLTPGNHTVRIQVTDDNLGTDTGEQSIVIGNRPPTASFDFRPAAPLAGQLVTFFSTADDPDKNIERIDWDLDGDGSYETFGSSASRTFSAGSFNVSMRVMDTGDSFAIVTQTIVVSVPPAAPKGEVTRLRALTPFPIVRMAGRIVKSGTKLRVLTVDVPAGSTLTVRCAGKGCPFTRDTRAAKAARKLRVRKLENRLLRSGMMIKIFVTKAGTIGKYTSIKIRRGKPPKRVDRCLMPGSMRPAKCQS